MHSAEHDGVCLTFFQPSEKLQPFVTLLYHISVDTAGGPPIEDALHPEWAHFRLFDIATACAAVGDEPLVELPDMIVAGPTSKTTRFRIGTGRSWGIGLQPLGWAQLIGADASHYADRMTDIEQAEGMEEFSAIRDVAFSVPDDPAREAQAIDEALLAILERAAPVDQRIYKIHALLFEEGVTGVSELSDRAGMTQRTLERFCKRWFGFTPSLLLARQRFVGCLGRFMLDPSLSWLSILEDHYYDQAHFVRDFYRFMAMSPSDYAKMPHPVLMAATQARNAASGEPMQVLQKPKLH